MSDLMIHSMLEFSSLIIPCLEHAGVTNIAEIGSEFGGMSKLLAEHSAALGGTLTCIDPEPADGFALWARNQSNVRHVPQPSLNALADGVDEGILGECQIKMVGRTGRIVKGRLNNVDPISQTPLGRLIPGGDVLLMTNVDDGGLGDGLGVLLGQIDGTCTATAT